MPNENQLIRSVTEPTIVLDEMSMQDVENGTANAIGSPKSEVQYSNQYGDLFPFVQVNDFVFDGDQIASMEIRSTGVRPTATVEVRLANKSFYTIAYPKDGDLMSIFIRPNAGDILKPFRNDYEITNVSVYQGSTENAPDTVSISGILRVPGLDAEKCFSKKGTSYSALLQTSSDLSLGFSSNEIDTSDSQNWICPFDTVENFLYNVTNSSWKNSKSFFTYFIDTYYNLNFINMEPLFSESLEIEESILEDLFTQSYGKDSKQGISKTKTILSNIDDMKNTNFYVTSYALQNYSASINLNEGYKRYAQYYDSIVKEYQSIFIDPNTTPGAENDKIILKGRSGENFYEDQTKRKWLGSISENNHEKLPVSKIHNYQNNVHLNKMVMKITLDHVNFNLRRMQVIPLVIVIHRDMMRKKLNLPAETPDSNRADGTVEDYPFAVDKFYSGNYVIRDFVYRYSNGRFSQECSLLRREWPQPPQTS